MKLRELLSELRDAIVVGNQDGEINEVRDDSRLVTPGDLFVAIPGTAVDGRTFLADAIARGATALAIEQSNPGVRAPNDVPEGFEGTVVTVPNVRHALAVIAARRFFSAGALTLTAVTGTNGKTTTTYLVESMLRAAGLRGGVVGTIAYRLAGAEGDPRQPALSRPAPLTTPGALALHALLAEMHAGGATDVVLEASSIALEQARLDGCRFRAAGLTNLTQDHLDYHGTMDRYLDAKAILFERLLDPDAGVAVLPVDRPEGLAMRARVRGRPVLGVASTTATAGADIAVESATLSAAGVQARIATPAGAIQIVSPLVGDYNLGNITLAVGLGIARGLAPETIAAGITGLAGVPGRLERVANDRGVLCVVDYAHTPDALERAIEAMRPLVAAGGRLSTVFGCGGDRDRTKRPLMGQAAAHGSDLAIVTSDNPRGEDPDVIISMILEGVRREKIRQIDEAELDSPLSRELRCYHVVADRRAAIRRAVAAARAGDVLLIAGKGHEDYQIIGANRVHFDDREEAAAAFARRPLGHESHG
jgi:UDP-N-acetylmuramoyl-L-alanyl-D-glutamate--2,6-diaminopimelate ligase